MTAEEARSYAASAIKEKRQIALYTPNAEIGQMCVENEDILKTVNSAELVVADGVGVILASKLLKTPLPEKIAGVEFGDYICSFAAKEGVSVFFFGSKPGVAEEAGKKMQEKYPELVIAGTRDGYLDVNSEENERLTEEINKSGAAILLVCLGAPKQEIWITENRSKLPNVYFLAGLGGSLDIYSGNAKRAPKIFISLGLEWFYRLLCQPKRIGRMMKLPVFLFSALKYKRKKKQMK